MLYEDHKCKMQISLLPFHCLCLQGKFHSHTCLAESGDFPHFSSHHFFSLPKPLDREKQEVVKLELMARNEAPLVRSSSSWKSVPIELTVTDVDEGPEFSAPVLRLKVKENVPNGTLIGTYTAVDPETKSSNGIK